MEKEKLEIVLEDILDELKTVNNSIQEQKQQFTQLQQRCFAIEEKTNQLKLAEPPVVNIKPIEACINDAMMKIDTN